MFETVQALLSYMKDNQATRILYKRLAENDNSKQQIYLGGDFDALNRIPYGSVREDNIGGTVQNFKASLNFSWISDEGKAVMAPRAQLILYPKYPEVRLSGFLAGCSAAPSKMMQPVPKSLRSSKNAKDGRILFMGICDDGRILARMVPSESSASVELTQKAIRDEVFTELLLDLTTSPRSVLLDKMTGIIRLGWIPGCRLISNGSIMPYQSSNSGGYTLEAQFGIIPNGRSEPDWHGWELKAYTGSRITLMTPEPNGGLYGIHGVEAFVRKYGYVRNDGTVYFTGVHTYNIFNEKTGMRLLLDGYDCMKSKITSVTGGIVLMDQQGNSAATWSFAKLLEHWGRKHAHTAYVPYKKQIQEGNIGYIYRSPILLGENGDFLRFLQAFGHGLIVLDPAPKVYLGDSGKTRVKARNQFRINARNLGILYERFDAFSIE